MTEGLGRALARPTQPVHRPWSPSGRRRGSEVPVPRPRAWRSAAERLPAAAAGWAKSINPLLRHEVEAVHRLGSLGYQTGLVGASADDHGRATCTKSLMSQDTSDEVTMCSRTAVRAERAEKRQALHPAIGRGAAPELGVVVVAWVCMGGSRGSPVVPYRYGKSEYSTVGSS